MLPDINNVISIVREASALMVDAHIEIDKKDGFANIVTSADRNIQNYLCERLAGLLPDCGFICEEEDFDTRDGKEYLWIIDPIDGTANFSRHIPECCISVALKSHDSVLMGVVYNPYHEDLFQAEKGKGAMRNGKSIHVSERTFADGLLCTAMSLYNKQYAQICSNIIMDAYMKCNDVRRFGACALEICYLAAGLYDLYFEYRVMPWDYSAAYLILTEAGGFISDRSGKQLHCDRPTMLVGANNSENHRRLVEIVEKYTEEDYYEYR